MAEHIATTGVAELDRAREPLKVVTNSLHNAALLAQTTQCDVQLLGGQVRSSSKATIGDVALRTLGGLRGDVAFIGTNALTVEHGLSTPDNHEAALKRAMLVHAKKVIALCDSTKLGIDYLVSFATLSEVDVLITDQYAPPSFVRSLSDEGLDVVIAQGD